MLSITLVDPRIVQVLGGCLAALLAMLTFQTRAACGPKQGFSLVEAVSGAGGKGPFDVCLVRTTWPWGTTYGSILG